MTPSCLLIRDESKPDLWVAESLDCDGIYGFGETPAAAEMDLRSKWWKVFRPYPWWLKALSRMDERLFKYCMRAVGTMLKCRLAGKPERMPLLCRYGAEPFERWLRCAVKAMEEYYRVSFELRGLFLNRHDESATGERHC